MINEIFNNHKFLKDYFETYFKQKRRFPQSIIFESSDTITSFFFTLELARILNCKETGAPDCNCLNCKWIKENSHPDIINITPLDFKDDNTKTVISVKQVEKISSIINQTSDNHRFFIFSNAKIAPYNEQIEKSLKTFLNAGYSLNKEDWQPAPLTKKIFQEESSNALLKSVEEAPDKVTFVFLTNAKDNIISTIVSRSLVFKMNSNPMIQEINVSEFLSGYPNFNIETGLNLSEKLAAFIDENEYEPINILNSMQSYLLDLIKSNTNLIRLIEGDIKRVELAKKHIMASITQKNALEALYIDLSTDGRKLL